MSEITHFDLCKRTAKRFKKNSAVVLYDYQNIIGLEYPDVLCYSNKGSTTLFEIKVSRSDFLSDPKKECRIKYKNRGIFFRRKKNKAVHYDDQEVKWETLAPELMFIEKPHLGGERYYVCPEGLISPEEVPNGWGLYWYKNRKFYLKKASSKFQRAIHYELSLLTHAFRKYASRGEENVNMLIDTYTYHGG